MSSDRRRFFLNLPRMDHAGVPKSTDVCHLWVTDVTGVFSMKDLPTCVKCSNFARNDKTCIYIGGWSSWSSIQ